MSQIEISEIQAVQSSDGSAKISLRMRDTHAALIHANGNDIIEFTCAPDYPPLIEKLTEALALPLTKDPSGEDSGRKIILKNNEIYYAPKAELFAVMDALESKMFTDNSGAVEVECKQKEPAFAGAISCPTPQPPTGTAGFTGLFPGMMQPQITPAAPAKSGTVHADGSWDCACGVAGLTSKFCYECGAAKPAEWTCACGGKNYGKFCTECGKPKPTNWKCPHCGAENAGRFCTECGGVRPE